jgi:hypothetical protein
VLAEAGRSRVAPGARRRRRVGAASGDQPGSRLFPFRASSDTQDNRQDVDPGRPAPGELAARPATSRTLPSIHTSRLRTGRQHNRLGGAYSRRWPEKTATPTWRRGSPKATLAAMPSIAAWGSTSRFARPAPALIPCMDRPRRSARSASVCWLSCHMLGGSWTWRSRSTSVSSPSRIGPSRGGAGVMAAPEAHRDPSVRTRATIGIQTSAPMRSPHGR